VLWQLKIVRGMGPELGAPKEVLVTLELVPESLEYLYQMALEGQTGVWEHSTKTPGSPLVNHWLILTPLTPTKSPGRA
jgi:hypothetical protein